MRGHRTILLLTCMAAVSSAALAQSTGKTVRKHTVADETPAQTAVRNAEAAIDKKDYEGAETYLRDAIAQDGNSYRAWFDLAFVFTAQGKRSEAIEAYKKSIAADPTIFETNLNLGLMLARDGNPEAEKYLRAATLLKPGSKREEQLSHAWMALGRFLQKSSPSRAVEAFKSAETLQPKNVEAYLAAASCYEQLKQYTAAEAEFKRALDVDPKSSEALGGLIDIYQQNGRLAEAETLLRKYVAVDPKNATAHAQLGRVLSLLGKNSDAATEFQAALEIAPGNAAISGQLVDALVREKKFTDAEAILKPLVAASPNDPLLHYQLGHVYMQARDFQNAQNELIAALKLKGDLAEGYGDLAIVASENQNYVLALQSLDARAKFMQETPATYFLRATALDHLHDVKNAIENYRLFLQAANGRFPDQEWKARHRLIALEPKK